MSTTQSALIGSGGRFTSNPRQIPRVAVFHNKLAIKSGAASSADSSTAGFFTALALCGAQTSVAVSNTYVTALNITSGSGYMVNVISPEHSASCTPSTKITVDGIVYTIAPTAALPATTRFVLGPTLSRQSTAAAGTAALADDIILPNSALDNGFVNASVGGFDLLVTGDVAISIPKVRDAIAFGMQIVRFEQSLKVEFAIDNISATAAHKQCGVSYILDI